MRDIEFRLIGHRSPHGTLLATDAISLTDAVRTLVHRITREVMNRPGLGRAGASIEKLSEVRLGLDSGSTRAIFTVGDEEQLFDDLWAAEVDEIFWSLVDGMARNSCPRDTSPTVAGAMDELVKSLSRAAPQMEITVADHRPVAFETRHLDRRPWQEQALRPAEQRQVSGLLEMVDLHSARFRILDVVGNRIELIDVADPQQAARLIDHQVVAHGAFTPGDSQRRGRLEGATITSAADRPDIDWATLPYEVDLEVLTANARNLPPLEAAELSNDEFEAFLAAVHE